MIHATAAGEAPARNSALVLPPSTARGVRIVDLSAAGPGAVDEDVYPDIWRHIRDLRVVADHPVAFYQRCGYAVYGLLPDASGWGKPGILMARRLGARP